MKYIDAELLRKEIERQRQFIEELFTEGDNSFYDGQDDAYYYILAFLGTLPEQPASEGLEEEARKYLTKNYTPPGDKESLSIEDAAYALWFDDVCHLARHFAEWGAEHLKK